MYCLVCERESQSPSAYCELCGYALVEDSARESLSCAECGAAVGTQGGGECSKCGAHVMWMAPVLIDERASDWDAEAGAARGTCLACGCAVESEQNFCRPCEAELAAVSDSVEEGDLIPSEAILRPLPVMSALLPGEQRESHRGHLQRLYAACYDAEMLQQELALRTREEVGSIRQVSAEQLPDFQDIFRAAHAEPPPPRRRAWRRVGAALMICAFATPGWWLYWNERKQHAQAETLTQESPAAPAASGPQSQPSPPTGVSFKSHRKRAQSGTEKSAGKSGTVRQSELSERLASPEAKEQETAAGRRRSEAQSGEAKQRVISASQ